MKLFVFPMIVLLFWQSCSHQELQTMEVDELTYKAATRGYFLVVLVKNDTAHVQKEPRGPQIAIPLGTSAKKAMDALVAEASSFPRSMLDENAAMVDAAIPATLTIVKGETEREYELDHTKAPKSVHVFLDEVLKESKPFE